MPVNDHEILPNAMPGPRCHASNVQCGQQFVIQMQDKVQVRIRFETVESFILLLRTDRIHDEAIPQGIGESGGIPIMRIESCDKLQEIESDSELHIPPVLVHLELG